MTSSTTTTLRASVQTKHEPDTLHDSPRHSLPSQKTSMIRRFLRTSKKDTQPLTLPATDSSIAPSASLNTKLEPVVAPSSPSSSLASTTPSEVTVESMSPLTVSSRASSSSSNYNKAPSAQPQASLTRVKQSLTRKINAKRVGAEPSASCTTSPPSSPRSSTVKLPRDVPVTVAAPSYASIDSDSKVAEDTVIDKRQNRLKRWQSRGTTKLKNWLKLHASQRDPAFYNRQASHVVEQQPVSTLETNAPSCIPDVQVLSSNTSIRPSLEVDEREISDCSSQLSDPYPRQEPKSHRRRASEHTPFVYASALQTLRSEHINYRRPMRNLSRGRLDGPGKIPIRSSSLPRSFSTSNSALWNRSPSLPPCKDDLQTSISLSDTAASFTALDDIIEDGVETLAMDITSTSPVEDIIVAAISDESSISCEEHSRPPPSTSLENTYRPVEDETTLTLPASGRAVSRPPTSKRKKRCNRAKRPSDISHLVSKVVPLRARRELKRRLIAHRSSASTSESVALDTRCDQNEKDTTNTFIDPIVDEKAHAPAMHASVSIPVEKEITLDEELLHSSKAIMQPSTMLVVLHDTNPTVNTDTLKPDYSRSIIMRVLQSTDPSKSRWQQETIANALSTINFWSSLRQKESLGV